MKSKLRPVENKPTTVTLRIVLEKPTAGVDFGLQEGHGSVYSVVAKQRSTGGDLEFEFTVRYLSKGKTGRNDGLPNFTGPFVQGPAGERFVYINIGTNAGQTNTPWSRRLKIPLSLITWDMLCAGKVWWHVFQAPERMAGQVARMHGARASVHRGSGNWARVKTGSSSEPGVVATGIPPS